MMTRWPTSPRSPLMLLALAGLVVACGGTTPIPTPPLADRLLIATTGPIGEAGTAPAVELVWQTDDGPERLSAPTGLAVDQVGVLTVVGTDGYPPVRLESASGRRLPSPCQPGRPGGQDHGSSRSPADAIPPDPDPPYGRAVAIDPAGHVYLGDPRVHRLQVFDQHGCARLGPAYPASAGSDEQLGDDLQPTVWTPAGLALDRQARLYVADYRDHRVDRFDGQGRRQASWGQLGTDLGQFINPVAIAVDQRGHVIVLDRGNERVQVFDGDGQFVRAWGGVGRGPGEFAFPTGLAVDRAGRVYVADSGNHRVQVFSDTGLFLAAWGSLGTGPGRFAAMSGIAVDAAGAVYVADRALGRVQKFRPTAPWPAIAAATPTPRPAWPTPAPPPPSPPPMMTPTDR